MANRNRAAPKREIKVDLYVNNSAKSSAVLEKFMEANLQEINKKGITINFIAVTPKNSASLRQKGIEATPALVFNGKIITGLAKILSELQPAAKAVDPTYGITSSSPEESVSNMWYEEIVKGKDDNGDGPMGLSKDEISAKMNAIQARRPQIEGMGKGAKTPTGGRKIQPSKVQYNEFADDETFVQAAGNRAVEATPTAEYYDDRDGASLLEQYYNDQADQEGRKPMTRPRRRPQEN